MSRNPRPNMKDPRTPGMICWNAYWGDWYTVLDVREYFGGTATVFEVAWSDGRVTVHSTAWDMRDEILHRSEAA